MKCILQLVVIATTSCCGFRSLGDEIPQVPSSGIACLERLMDHEVANGVPKISLEQMGYPIRPVEGRLVDHEGAPLADVAVAVVVTHLSHKHYLENFTITDQDGWFYVEGRETQDHLVFLRNTNDMPWAVPSKIQGKLETFVWPAPATVTINIPVDVVNAGEELTIRRIQRSQWKDPHCYKQASAIHVVVPNNRLITQKIEPGDYLVTKQHDWEFGNTKSQAVSYFSEANLSQPANIRQQTLRILQSLANAHPEYKTTIIKMLEDALLDADEDTSQAAAFRLAELDQQISLPHLRQLEDDVYAAYQVARLTDHQNDSICWPRRH